jgi:hypothetical protein
MISSVMAKATNVIRKRRTPGNPPILVRMQPLMLELLDAWVLHHNVKNHGGYSRPEAVRRIIAAALSPPASARAGSPR